MINSASVSRKEKEDAYPTGAPGPCCQVLVESELLIYFLLLCIIMLLLGYIFRIPARILVPLINRLI